jgi:hypothetical protein
MIGYRSTAYLLGRCSLFTYKMSSSNITWNQFLGAWQCDSPCRKIITVNNKPQENVGCGNSRFNHKIDKTTPWVDLSQEVGGVYSINRLHCTKCKVVWWEPERKRYNHGCPNCSAIPCECVMEIAWMPMPKAAWDAWHAAAGITIQH